MRPVEVVILVISLVVVILAIVFGRAWVEKRYTYGTWKTLETPCINESNDCTQPAFQFTDRICVPDPTTRRGCINDQGVQVYATEITSTPCTLQCRKFKWDIDIGACNTNTGLQPVTYTCRAHDDEGINACTVGGLIPYNGGSYQDVVEYGLGDVVTWDIRCLTPNPPVTEKLQAPYETVSLDSDSSHYLIDEACSAKYILGEGYLQHGQPCRRWSSKSLVFMIRTSKGLVVPYQTPNDGPGLARFRHWNKEMNRKLYDTPLTCLPRTYRKSGCSDEDIDFSSGALFLLGPVGRTGDAMVCRIGVIIDNKYWGWLKTKKHEVTRVAMWTQAKMTPKSPGINSDEAMTFQVTILNNHIVIHDARGLDIMLDGDVFEGNILHVNTQADFTPRQNGWCNIFH